MKKSVYIMILLLFTNNLHAQIIDTCFVNENRSYYSKNQGQNSLLYWEITGGKIISENPGKNDSIQVVWKETGIQELSVYEKTENNCLGYITSVQIIVIQQYFDIELTIPNSFSPNGDNKNDSFAVKANYTPQNYHISIFDRWGNKVFESNNISNSWDGANDAGNCQAGVYYYIIQYQNKDKTITKKGFLHLFR